MFAGRFSWLCHGTIPPGCTTSLRKRIFRPSNPDPIGARSIDEITVSVTLEGVIGPGFTASTAVLPGGQSAAHDWAGIIGNAHTATAVIIRVVESLEITLMGRTPVLAGWITRVSFGTRHRLRLRESVEKSATKGKSRLPMNSIGPSLPATMAWVGDEITQIIRERPDRDIAKFQGSESWMLPIPATFDSWRVSSIR